VTLNFAHHFALVGNTFDTVNGPVDPAKNDSETILSEGGGNRRTESLGTVASATATTLTDSKGTVNPNARVNGAIPENYGLAIVAGTGAGQSRRVTQFNAGTYTVDRAWDVLPDSSSRYAAAMWTVEKALFKGNRLSNSPRGLMLYGSAVREVDLVGNTMAENGGILVRATQQMSAGWFTPILNVRIADNTIVNTTRLAASTLAVHFANIDGQAFGTAMIGVEVRHNAVTANSPNLDFTRFEGPVGIEGYTNQMNVESSAYTATALPRLLGTVLQANTCTHCATAFRLGTGAAGTVLSDNVLVDTGSLWSNTATSTSSEKALDTTVH
jgi:hypothetical protein